MADSTTTAITIRPLATFDEFVECEEVQYKVWNMDDYRQVVPAHVLLTAAKEGGLVAAAFDEQAESRQMVAFLFGFAGRTAEGRFKHCSHMMGVLPSMRKHNIGYHLKLFQRQYVQKQDLDLITWTYDPLEGLNATLNIAKLGAVARKYTHNLYGDNLGGLNRGLPTDRFEVEWWINSPRVREFVEVGRSRPTLGAALSMGARQVLTTEFDTDGIPQPTGDIAENRAALEGDHLLIEVPADFQAVKAKALETAQDWRRRTAVLFSEAFTKDYVVVDFFSHLEAAYRRNFYVLSRRA